MKKLICLMLIMCVVVLGGCKAETYYIIDDVVIYSTTKDGNNVTRVHGLAADSYKAYFYHDKYYSNPDYHNVWNYGRHSGAIEVISSKLSGQTNDRVFKIKLNQTNYDKYLEFSNIAIYYD